MKGWENVHHYTMSVEKLPTAEDICPFEENIGAEYAKKNFLNKNIQEAYEMFKDNTLHYTEDLIEMGDNALLYYYKIIIMYLNSDDAEDDECIISQVAGLLSDRFPFFFYHVEIRDELMASLEKHIKFFNNNNDTCYQSSLFENCVKTLNKVIKKYQFYGVNLKTIV